VQADDAAGEFRALFERHHRAVLAYLLRRIGPDVAHDAAEDVFLVAWRRLADMPSDAEQLAWLYGVARRVAANHRRSVFRRGRLIRRAALNPPNPPVGPEAEAVRHAEADSMLAALATLRERDQEVLRLTYWEELPHAEIGEILGCSAEAVHVRRYRAERRLANALARRGHKKGGRRAASSKPREERC
jgi:RNA polymerase sigma-70 factor (ECF subfamily)